MRRILIDRRVKGLAKNYKDKVHAHARYGVDDKKLVSPRKRLASLLKAFVDGKVKSDAGNPLDPGVSASMHDYLQLLISEYDDGLLDATPSKFDTLNARFDQAIIDTNLYGMKLKVGSNNAAAFHDIIVTALCYADIRQYIYPQYIRQFKIKACVYCNAAFCVTDNDGVAYYTVDHWMPKSRYPHFAISFFNLVPCCFSCNRNKGDDGGEYFCLYEDEPGADRDVLHLKVSDKSIATYIMSHDAEVLDISLTEANPKYKSMRENMDRKLHISNLYAEHKDVAEEALWRRIVYNGSNTEALNQLFKNASLRLSDYDVRRFVYGTYPDSDDMHRRPLSRLIQDLMDE